MIGGECLEFGGETGSFEVGQLIGVESDGNVLVLSGLEESASLFGGEADGFSETVYVVD